PDVDAAPRCARNLRTRVPQGAGQPLRRQYLADGRVRRDGGLGAPPQAEVARRRRLERAEACRESPMSTVATCRTARPWSISRIAASSSATDAKRLAQWLC